MQQTLLRWLSRRPPPWAAATPSAPRLERRIPHQRVCRNTSGTRHVRTEREARIAQKRGGLYHRTPPWGRVLTTDSVTSNPALLTPPAREPSLLPSRFDVFDLSPRIWMCHPDRTTLAPNPSRSEPHACMGGALAVEGGRKSRILKEDLIQVSTASMAL